MSDGTFSVDTARLDQAAPQMQELAARIRSVATKLDGRLEALGACWGDDESGRQFLEQYAEPKRQLSAGITGAGTVLDSTVDGIRTMAKGFRQTEEQNVETLRALTPATDSGTAQGSSPHRTRR
ncbi:WXG100 family type VII secretion target [Streptomyces sp. LP11]|uniref:WXG100 family type VII secretion target n=1 Tax=Streptomyces pyxinicus TaxID=2970331 RepID=A0ABT2BE13_9ACTN|nr:WXG100 family type VII secretion target [Streptomyces sp. LP11]MCS0606300.1 WXG100 family type VII secretion target [Streptomyces sp. LP11]